jgi:hypothetical protein
LGLFKISLDTIQEPRARADSVGENDPIHGDCPVIILQNVFVINGMAGDKPFKEKLKIEH